MTNAKSYLCYQNFVDWLIDWLIEGANLISRLKQVKHILKAQVFILIL